MTAGQPNLRRYYFVVEAPDHKHDDPWGIHLPDHEAAKDYGHRIVKELKEGGYHPPDSILVVRDEMGNTIHSIPF
jgi:hypothetical protein